MSVGIASLWYEHPELLPEFVRLMRGQPWDELILVDNASPEPATQAAYAAAVAELGPGARVMRMAQNSVLHGWNAGIAALGTDVVVQMANDVLLTDERWLTWGLEGVADGILQGPVCWQRGNVRYIDGCMLVTTAATWRELKGLDAGAYVHPGYWSDVDLCWRATLRGGAILPTRCGIQHLVNYTSGGIDAVGFSELEQRNAWTFTARYTVSLWQQRGVVRVEDLP